MTRQKSSNRTPESHSLWGSAILSAMMHAGVLAAAFIIWPKLAPPDVLPSDIVPVDLEIADETNVTPQQEAPEAPPVPEPLPVPQMAAEAPPPPPEPPPPPDDNSFALQEEKKKPDIEEKKPAPPLPRFAQIQPRMKPKPDSKKDAFDIDKIASLVEKIDSKSQSSPREGAKPQATKTLKGAGAQSAMTANEIDAFKSQLRKCWNVPVGAPDPAALVFRLRIFLNQDGSVAAAPELVDQAGLADPYFRAAVDSAKRAVHMCSPFQLPTEKYDAWNDITVTFDPTKMAGY